MLITSTLIYMQFSFIQPVYASPDKYYSKPTNHSETLGNFEVGHPATDAYDKDNATYARFNYELAGGAAGNYYFDLMDFTKAGGAISSVDFKMKYMTELQKSGGTYSIQFSIDGSSWTTLVAATIADHAVPGAGCDVWASQTCPVGSWNWTKINNIQFRVETTYAKRGTGMFNLYEGWVTVHFTPPATPTVYIDPSSKIDLAVTPPAESYSLMLRPNEESTYWYDEWFAWDDEDWIPGSADYSNWDEATPNDSDYNWIDDEYYFQASNLTDHTSETWSIAKVKLTARASANQYSDDKLILMLVIGDMDYTGVTVTNVSTSWTEYTSTWGMNPATMDQWTWDDIDDLAAGVYTDSGETWWDNYLEVYVSQLYVEVFGPGIKFDLCIDYLADFWQWQFEMYYNPDVLQAVYADEGMEYPVSADPDGFLAEEGGTLLIAGGPGWDNTMGKLWLTSANLLNKIGAVTGGGRIATFMMECGVGKGESNLTLGSLTAVYDVSTGFIQPSYGHGYFRNVDLAELPTASFTKTPDSPLPDPTEGYNVTFDASASTPNGGTIVEYKWYFGRNFPYDTLDEIVTTTSTTVQRNYTARSPPGKVYNVTLTVKDSNDAVASKKDSFQVKAHDIAVVETTLWGVPGAPDSVTVGEIAKINVTISNQGHYNEADISVSCLYLAPGGSPTLIDTQTGFSVNVGQEVNATFTWDTTGLTPSEIPQYRIWGNASTVDYEYERDDNSLEDSPTGVSVLPSAVPEFPLGAAMEISLVAAVIYLWWRSRRKRKPFETYPKTSI